MKRVLLVYPGYIVREQPLNILYISAAVKAAGHDAQLFEITPYRKRPLWGDPFRIMVRAFREAFASYRPDVVGFSVMSVNTRISSVLARAAKAENPDVLIVYGGIHPTIAPEETIAEDFVDAICRGEGDDTMIDFLEALDQGRDWSEIPGLWTKRDGAVRRNPLRPLIRDLDRLPFPDRAALPPSSLNAELYGVNLLTSRGCPFPCAYCQNKFLMDLYRGEPSFVRYRSIDNVFAEIDAVLREFRPGRLSFSDESFTLNKAHLRDFCAAYTRRYRLPFLCQTRPDLIDEEKIVMLKEAGCDFINMAIESGNPDIRNGVLKRNISQDQIRTAYTLAHRHGIRTGSFNIIGLPQETPASVWDTINLNKELQPDRIMCTIFMPFRGTELGEKCLAEGWLEHPIDDSEIYYTYVSIRHPTISGRTLFGYQGFFDYYVRLSRKLYPLVHFLRLLYQRLPLTTDRLFPPMRLLREAVIDFVYRMKRFLPGRGIRMKTR
ncbi:MAG: radical SAM protein [Acidobacteriota bacterium]|nr:radical SAM protein [Acidobacteriota bacterium]